MIRFLFRIANHAENKGAASLLRSRVLVSYCILSSQAIPTALLQVSGTIVDIRNYSPIFVACRVAWRFSGMRVPVNFTEVLRLRCVCTVLTVRRCRTCQEAPSEHNSQGFRNSEIRWSYTHFSKNRFNVLSASNSLFAGATTQPEKSPL